MKRTEVLALRVTPEALEQWTARANALGLSVQLWAGRALDKASVGPMPSEQRMAEDWAERYLASLHLDD